MNPCRFPKTFDALVDAATGVDRLRELILDLAVRGKLVPPVCEAVSAADLLRVVSQRRDELIQRGQLRPVRLPPIEKSQEPFQLPSSWTWVRLGDALLKITDGTHHSPPNKKSGDYLYVTAKNIKPEGIDLSHVTYVTSEIHREIYARCNPELGDILYIKDGATTGIVTINQLRDSFSMLSSVALLKPPPEIRSKFLVYVLRSPFFYAEMRAGMTGVAITRVTLDKLHRALIALAPLEEQDRIVAKVDELMALCDELDARQQRRQEVRTRLNDASLDQLASASDPSEFATAWQRVRDNFDLLYAVPENVAKLRQAILQLAVQGKLVPQDPDDEPVAAQLSRVAAIKKKLQDCGQLQKDKKPSAIKRFEPECHLIAL